MTTALTGRVRTSSRKTIADRGLPDPKNAMRCSNATIIASPDRGARLGTLAMMRLPVELWPALSRISGASSWPPQTDAEADQFLRQAAAENLLPLLFEDDSV